MSTFLTSVRGAGPRLRQLLGGDEPVLAPGAYDVLSARLVELAGFPAVYMTGFGTAASYLGRPDVGLLRVDRLETRPHLAEPRAPRPRLFTQPGELNPGTGPTHNRGEVRCRWLYDPPSNPVTTFFRRGRVIVRVTLCAREPVRTFGTFDTCQTAT
jgi:hypothetical protein